MVLHFYHNQFVISSVNYVTESELDSALSHLHNAPADLGRVELIACRPRNGERAVLQEAKLDLSEGLIGDNWKARGSSKTADGSAHPDMQLTVMNARVIALVAREKNHWPLAGDQLFIDLDISAKNLPPGSRLAIGSAIIEISSYPHTGCKKFADRFGAEAVKFVNSEHGKDMRFRGLNARIVRSGVVHVGDVVKKLEPRDPLSRWSDRAGRSGQGRA
jgi:hypothetical protein